MLPHLRPALCSAGGVSVTGYLVIYHEAALVNLLEVRHTGGGGGTTSAGRGGPLGARGDAMHRGRA